MRIVMLGAPGSGKGTQGDLLAKHYGIPKSSTGDALRAAVKAGTPMGLKAKAAMDAGQLVADELVIGIIRERLQARRYSVMVLSSMAFRATSPRRKCSMTACSPRLGQSPITPGRASCGRGKPRSCAACWHAASPKGRSDDNEATVAEAHRRLPCRNPAAARLLRRPRSGANHSRRRRCRLPSRRGIVATIAAAAESTVDA